jgi:hypothetical protein
MKKGILPIGVAAALLAFAASILLSNAPPVPLLRSQAISTPDHIYWTEPEWIVTPFPVSVASDEWSLKVVSELRKDSTVITSTTTMFTGCPLTFWEPETPAPVPPIGVCNGPVPITTFDISGYPAGTYELWVREAWVSPGDPREFVIPWEPGGPACDLHGANCTVSLSEDLMRLVIPDSCYARLVQCGTRRDGNGFWFREAYTVPVTFRYYLPMINK